MISRTLILWKPGFTSESKTQGWFCAVHTYILFQHHAIYTIYTPLASTAKWVNVTLLRWISLRHSKQLQIWLYWFIASETLVGITYYTVTPVFSHSCLRCFLMEFVWSAWTAGNQLVHDISRGRVTKHHAHNSKTERKRLSINKRSNCVHYCLHLLSF